MGWGKGGYFSWLMSLKDLLVYDPTRPACFSGELEDVESNMV
jgi:hypothetical protein